MLASQPPPNRDYLQTTGFEPILENANEMNGLQAMDESMNLDDMDQLQEPNAKFPRGPNGFSGQVINQINNLPDASREFINNQIIENVSNEVINAQVNRSLNNIMAQYKSKFKK